MCYFDVILSKPAIHLQILGFWEAVLKESFEPIMHNFRFENDIVSNYVLRVPYYVTRNTHSAISTL